LSDSPFFKTLDSKPLTAIAEALQTEGRQQGCGRFVHCDCFYQSDTGLDRLFVLSDSDTQVTLSLQPASGGGAATRFRTGGLRLLYSPSGLARSLLSERQRQSISQAVHSFPCSLHARMPPDGFWSISFASIANCLDAWPEAKRHLLLQLWSHINDTLLLVLVEWLGLEAGSFLETKFYEDLLSQEIDRLADEVAATSGVNFASMSFYERRPLYRRLAVRLLEEISGTASPSEGAEDHITIVYCSVAPDKEALDGFRAFLVLEGRLETTPTQATLGVSQGSSSVLPGWVGLVPYFAQSRLPFQVRPAVDDADDEDDAKRDGSGVVGGGGGGGGVVLAIISDALMDEMFRSPKATESSSEAAVSFLLRQLTRQVFLYDMLINNRRLHRGDHLVRKGDPTETVEIVVSGRLRRDVYSRRLPGLIEGLMESGAVSTCWSGDIVAVRESRAVSLPLSLARAWVSNTRRLNILDRLLGSMCEAQLDRQQQRLTRLQRRKQTRLRVCRRDASDNGFKENNDDDLGYAPDEDEKPVAHVTAWLTRQRRRNRSRLVDPTRFNLNELLHHLQLCLDAAHGTATAMVVSETDVERHFGRPADQLPDAALRNWLEDLELAFSVLVLVSTG
uniref:Cyclic nucleotide-binding domain-containing protein n=1 Tax=Macrostomum lignano TaxID=282301 RepID=A0A1I8I6R1_9PLAT